MKIAEMPDNLCLEDVMFEVAKESIFQLAELFPNGTVPREEFERRLEAVGFEADSFSAQVYCQIPTVYRALQEHVLDAHGHDPEENFSFAEFLPSPQFVMGVLEKHEGYVFEDGTMAHNFAGIAATLISQVFVIMAIATVGEGALKRVFLKNPHPSPHVQRAIERMVD